MNKQIDSKIWVIIGAALAFVGFFLPYVSFSFSGFSVSLSAAKIAESYPYVYLIPACFLIVILFCIFKNSYPKYKKEIIITESILSVIGILCTIVVVIKTFGDPSGTVGNVNTLFETLGGLFGGIELPTIKTIPSIGLFVLVIAFVLLTIGIVGELGSIKKENGRNYLPANQKLPDVDRGNEDYYEPPQQIEEGWQKQEYEESHSYVAPVRVPVRSKKKKVSAWLISKDGRNYQLCVGETLIGRSSENDIQLTDPKISKRHAKIIESSGRFRLMDLGSTNGTWLNGNLVRQPTSLHSEDVIRFGDSYKVQFVTISR